MLSTLKAVLSLTRRETYMQPNTTALFVNFTLLTNETTNRTVHLTYCYLTNCQFFYQIDFIKACGATRMCQPW